MYCMHRQCNTVWVHSLMGSSDMMFALVQSAEFSDFWDTNQKWLRPYAVFKVLHGLFGTAEHWHWGALSRPTPRVRPPCHLKIALFM